MPMDARLSGRTFSPNINFYFNGICVNKQVGVLAGGSMGESQAGQSANSRLYFSLKTDSGLAPCISVFIG